MVKGLLFRVAPHRLHEWMHQVEASPLGSRLARGAFWSMTGSLASRGLGLVASIVVGRLLGKVGFGELGILQSTIAVFGTLAGFAMGLTANKHVAQFKRADPGRAGRILGLSSATAWLTSSVMAAALWLAAPWIASRPLAAPHLAPLLQVGALILLLTGINGAQTGALSGLEAFKTIARIHLATGLATFPLMIAGAALGGVRGAIWALAAIEFLNCSLCFFAVRREAARFGIQYRYSGWKQEWRLFSSFSVPALLTGFINTGVAWGASALVVQTMGGYAEMGAYNAAMRMKLLPEIFVALLIAPMLPILSEAFGKKDQASFQRTLLFNFIAGAMIIIPLALLQAAAPELTMMPFGQGYAGDTTVVQWLMLHSVVYALVLPMGNALIAMGRMWLSMGINALYAATLAVSALALIPNHGAPGYAAAQAASLALANVPTLVILYREMPGVMRALKWSVTAPTALGLFVAAYAAGLKLNFAASVATGLLCASAFSLLGFRLHGSAFMKARADEQ